MKEKLTYPKLLWMVLFPPGPGGGKEVDHGYKGKGSLLHLVVDKEGRPLWITTTSAKGNERDQALVLLNSISEIRLKNSKQMGICEADKGYDADDFRQNLLHHGYFPVIGHRRNRKNRVETQEIYDYLKIPRRRWVVERTFSWLKRKCMTFLKKMDKNLLAFKRYKDHFWR
jgi:IS5 family transposase